MTAALRTTLAAAFRRLPLWLLVSLGFAAVFAAWAFLEEGRERAQKRVSTLRAQAARVDAWSAELDRLGARGRKGTAVDARGVVESETAALGAGARVRIEHGDRDEVRVILERASFASWLSFIERLHAREVRLESSRLQAAAPGFVSGTATLRARR